MPGFPPKFEESVGILAGFGSAYSYNWQRQFPRDKKLMFYAVCTTLGYVAGVQFLKFKENSMKKRYIYIGNFVQNHPEEFEIHRHDRKFKDILDPWTPKRNS